MSKSLLSLLPATKPPVRVSGDAQVSDIADNSKLVAAGSLFVCMPSKSRDTHEFLEQVKETGATAAIVHSEDGYIKAMELGLAAVQYDAGPGFFGAVSLIAHALLDQPTQAMRMVGVTGTNGKTTTAWMLRDALRSMGRKASYMGTLGFDVNGSIREIPNTTPFPVQAAQMMQEARLEGCQDFVMETSSHALDEQRILGTLYDAAVFTNLTQDHLDFHGSMEAYESAKKRLFTEYAASADAGGKKFRGAVNAGDETGAKWGRELTDHVFTYGVDTDADLKITPLSVKVDSIDLIAAYLGVERRISLHVGGLFNVANAASCLAGLLCLGYSLDQAADAVEKVTPVPGRFEAISNDQGFGVIVDYAHTPDALEQLLKSARALNPSRIITVFGCGGDRDKTKRPKMAAVVSANAEVTVVTSDNPRTEDPQAILNDVLAGVREGADSIDIIDRREAIFHAIKIARPGDIVVIAGKGHEDYQIIGREKFHMDDREMAREALAARAN